MLADIRLLGRKRLGKMKRYHNIMLRFNDAEYDKLKKICESYNLDISERGVISPLLRRLVLQQKTEEKDRLPTPRILLTILIKLAIILIN